MKKLLLALPLLLLFGCPVIDEGPPDEIEGLRPIYISDDSWKEIQSAPARAIKKLGKIYYKDGLIYVAETNEGIHVIDNTDPTNPVFIKFIEIIGCHDVAIKGNVLYADNVSDLVALDISNLDDIQVLSRTKDLYKNTQLSYPPTYEGYFECVDPALGTIIGWEAATLYSPECFR